MNREELLAEIEGIRQCMPPDLTRRTRESSDWIGRAQAAIELWNPAKSVDMSVAVSMYHSEITANAGIGEIQTLISQAANDLRMKTVGPLSKAFDEGSTFDYFDGVRKIIESANREVFFIDPYLDAEFVSRHLSNVKDGVRVRLLAGKKVKSNLVPAVDVFVEQYKRAIEVRSHKAIHDRFVIIDGESCYLSGASFKDGAKKSPTTLTQITDVFGDVKNGYEQYWKDGKQSYPE